MKFSILFVLTCLVCTGCGSTSDVSIYNVTVNSSYGGSVNPLEYKVEQGREITFSIHADEGYQLQSVSGCTGELSGNTFSNANVTESCVLSVSFTRLAPENLIAAAGEELVSLSWNPVPMSSDYCIYVSTTPSINIHSTSTYDETLSACVAGSNNTSNTVRNLENGKEYFFVVTSKDQVNESPASNEVSALPVIFEPIGGLNDTGITLCGEVFYAGGISQEMNNLNCETFGVTQTSDGFNGEGSRLPAGQDAVSGRDAEALAGTLSKIGAGAGGFDFTKLDSNGYVLSETATDWDCVRDNVSGLIWEVKKDDNGLRDKDNTYSWYSRDFNRNGLGAGTSNGGICSNPGRCDLEKLVQDTNSASLCGYSDWRVPEARELDLILDYAGNSPAIDVNFFPNTGSNNYWTATSNSASSDQAYHVRLATGLVWLDAKSSANNALLVRGSSPGSNMNTVSCANENLRIMATTPSEDFEIHGNGTVTHTSTGLMWMRCSIGQTWGGVNCMGQASYLFWGEALDAAKSANAGNGQFGYKDWRLPNKKELASIVEYRCSSPSINEAIFPSTPYSAFQLWSSSPIPASAQVAWTVYFEDGRDSTDGKDLTQNPVRLVRTVQNEE